MIVNVLNSEDDDGQPENMLIVGFTVADFHQILEALESGATIAELPPIDLTALLTGTDTPGHVSFLRFLVGNEEEDIHQAITEDMDDLGYDDVIIEAHGDAGDGITAGWVSPLREGLSSDLDEELRDLLGGEDG